MVKAKRFVDTTLLLVALACALPAFASSRLLYLSGTDLVPLIQAQYRLIDNRGSQADVIASARLQGFVQGVHDSLSGKEVCADAGTSVGQLLAIVKKRIDEHPEQWNADAYSIIRLALSAAFPCRKAQ